MYKGGSTGTRPLKAPFPWFGGKSRVAHLVWERFGDVPNYVEPFAGSLAVLLGRPIIPGACRIETVNDLDCMVSNFWRALKHDPVGVAEWADWPVNEADLYARHLWLCQLLEDFRDKVRGNPDWCDAKIAGWWVWGISQWIGSGWCGYNIPCRQLPYLGRGGMGVHSQHTDTLLGYLATLSNRLRRVRVCCGDWKRILGPSPTTKLGITGVFLDPPYDQSLRDSVYNEESHVSSAVLQWALAHGPNPMMRIALCGYEGEHELPSNWACIPWKANGGYALQSTKVSLAGRGNSHKERIWFSPHCLEP